jgi:type 1 fimbriae regulatory protein FimB/type 1 fimbriae regulatory protein FimE
MKWNQIHFETGDIAVGRAKGSTPNTHPLDGKEIRAFRKIKRNQEEFKLESPYVFVSEQGGPLDQSVFRKIVKRAGETAALDLPAHPHMLRHGCGFYLANKGVDTRTIQSYLGHKNIQHTVRYTELSPGRFRNLWDD